MPVNSTDLLQGTLQILILKALFAEPTHGYGVARWIEQTTKDVLRVEEGSLYPALRRLEDKTFITSAWGTSENNRRARYYSVTPAGRAYLKREAAAWTRYSGAVTRVLRAEPSLV
jgi:PadR family transcriptional regulator PadR